MNPDIMNTQKKINQKTNVLYLLNVCGRPTKLPHNFTKNSYRLSIAVFVYITNFILALI